MRIAILLTFLCSCAFADQVLTGNAWKKDGTILFADAKPRIVVTTDADTGDVTFKEELPSEIKACVQIDDGECVESDHLKATVKDVPNG